MTDMPTLYHIPATNFARLEKEIEKINRRAARLETEPVKLQVHANEHVTRTDTLFDLEYEEIFFVCSVEGAAPQIEGYTLVASIQPVEGGENLVREVPGQKCPQQFRTADMSCDHCQINVQRKSVFIIQNEFGEYRQVGRNCLQDYLGGTNPESLLGRAEYMMDFAKLARDAEEREWGSHGGPVCVPINHFVAMCAILIQKLGWMPRSKSMEGQATADIAWSMCVDPRSRRDFVRDKDLKATMKALLDAEHSVDWAAKIDPESAPNNYLHDLGVCCRQQYVTHDRAGYVGSVLQAYQRYVEEELAKSQPDTSGSQHVGTEGEKGEFADLTITVNKELEPNQYGKRCRIEFSDPKGNVLNWFTKTAPEWVKVGDKVTISAIVKKHDEFRNIKQTTIKNVKVK
jgi:hypothetical protein